MIFNVWLEMVINQDRPQKFMWFSMIIVTKMMITIVRGGRGSGNQRVMIEIIIIPNDYNDGRPLKRILESCNIVADPVSKSYSVCCVPHRCTPRPFTSILLQHWVKSNSLFIHRWAPSQLSHPLELNFSDASLLDFFLDPPT